MAWTVKYLPEVAKDLDRLGHTGARRARKVIEERIMHGNPETCGKPLKRNLAGCRRIRTGDLRIIYRVNKEEVEVLVIAIGPRRNNKAYAIASKRL